MWAKSLKVVAPLLTERTDTGREEAALLAANEKGCLGSRLTVGI